MFQTNPLLIAAARAALAGRADLFWVLGGAGSGKSSVCQALSAAGASIYDMDAQIYGAFGPRYRADRHPASSAWLAAASPLAWMLELSDADFDAFGRATTAEYLDLAAEDLRDMPRGRPTLIDGGVTHPTVVAQVLPPERLICLSCPDAERVRLWEQAEERAMMRDWIAALPRPEAMWRRFLEHDAAITETMLRECRAAGVAVVERAAGEAVATTALRVAQRLGLRLEPGGAT